jgi:uncharacterized protein DUF6597
VKKEYLPHASLQRHVKCYWMMKRTYTPEHPAEEVTLDAFIELILHFEAPYRLRVDGGPDREMPRAILVGLQKKPLLFRCDGTVTLVTTRFFAWGGLPSGRLHGPSRRGLGHATGTAGDGETR